MKCQIDQLINRACSNEAVANITINNTTKGDLTINVCEKHLQTLRKLAKTTSETQKRRG